MHKLRFSFALLLGVTMLIGVVLAVFVWLNRPDPPIQVLADKSSEGPVIAIFRHAGFVLASEYHDPYVEFAVWNDGTVVCTDYGAVAIETGRTKQDYIDEWSNAYRLFRTNWAIIREESNKMIESGGTLFTGDPPERTRGLRQNAG